MPPKQPKQTKQTKQTKQPKQTKQQAAAPVKAAKQGKKGKKDLRAKKKSVPVKKEIEPRSVWERKPRNFGIGGAIRPPMDLTRFTKWPRYVILQRKKRVLQLRLKVPPQVNQFTKTLEANTAANVLKLLNKYRPEDKAAKRDRLTKIAKGEDKGAKPLMVKAGLNHVTKLIEEKKAALVVIAHDVDPIELVMFLPALCRKMEVPYCIIKGKARLGQVVHKKTATVLALTAVRQEDRANFAQLVDVVKSQYNDKYEETKKKWGGGQVGLKSQAVLDKRLKAAAIEESNKRKYLQ